MGLALVTSPKIQPVSLDDVKSHLRKTDDAEDGILRIYIESATMWAQQYARRSFIDQTWDYSLNWIPIRDRIVLPTGRISAIKNITYIDGDGASQTLTGPTSGSSPPGVDYQEDLTSDDQPLVAPKFGENWPDIRTDTFNVFIVRFISGYGTKGGDVPADIRTAILYRLADLHALRGSVDGDWTEVAKEMLRPYRLTQWARSA